MESELYKMGGVEYTEKLMVYMCESIADPDLLNLNCVEMVLDNGDRFVYHCNHLSHKVSWEVKRK